MMFKWSETSKKNLITCHNDLQELANLMLSRSKYDLSVICGFRTGEEQERLFLAGKSRARRGESKHNYIPALAMDIVPLPIDWRADNPKWDYLAALAYDCAGEIGIKIKCGRFFNGFEDSPHVELV